MVDNVPSIVIVTSCQPINQKCHGVDFGIGTMIMPQHSSFSFTCRSIKSLVLVIETALSTKQWTLQLIVNKFLQQLG